MIILRSWWWLARKKHKWKTPRCWFSWVLKSSTKRWEWNFLFANYFKYFLQLKHKKNQNIFRYFHKSQITICFLQTITNILNNSKIKSCNIFATKISRKVFRNKFSSGETVYVGTKAVCGKNHKRASTAYGCKYNHQNVIIDVPTWHSSKSSLFWMYLLPKRQKQGKNVRSVIGCVLVPSGDCM